MRAKGTSFSGKLMLFGEHTVVTGSSALLSPLRLFSGTWSTKNINTVLQHQLKIYVDYLIANQAIFPFLDFLALSEFMEEAVFFDSNIPQNYGVGSSGALVAALYEKIKKNEAQDVGVLQQRFAVMESFFHGNSSGIDPLACYLNRPLYMQAGQGITFPELDESRLLKNVWLFDSGIEVTTGPLVAYFREQLMSYRFYKALKGELLPVVDHAIQAKLTEDEEEVLEAVKVISAFQFRHFLPMIPDSVRGFWEDGLASSNYFMKLCGAGGGGYFLVFANDFQNIPEAPKGMKIISPLSPA